MSRKLKFIAVVLFGLAQTQCSQNPAAPEARDLTALERRLVDDSNQFGLKLFREIARSEESDKNIFISPLSVSMALGMTLNGANGETRSAMQQTLEFTGMTSDEINQSYRSLIDLLTKLDRKVVFEIANSIWYKQEMDFEQAFMDLNQTFFDARVEGVNFNNPEAAADLINSWVDENTHGRIEKIIEASDIDFNTVMFLINAIYFKGDWTFEFDKDLTADEPFNLSDGSRKNCKMMKLTGTLNYFENGSFQTVDLPYGDQLFSMTILLPKENIDIDSLAAELHPGAWQQWLDGLEKHNVNLSFPKFKLEYKLSLNNALQALGMGVAFTDMADFTGMYAPGGLFIDDVKHKTFVEVDEEGTEAAAVTSVEVGVSSVNPGIAMRVDRPFLFVIRENHSQTILFMGKIVEPVL